MNEKEKRIYDAGKIAQRLEDMNLLGAIITKYGGKIELPKSELLNEYIVARKENVPEMSITLEAITDKCPYKQGDSCPNCNK